jgi:hypothetical protein
MFIRTNLLLQEFVEDRNDERNSTSLRKESTQNPVTELGSRRSVLILKMADTNAVNVRKTNNRK